MAAFRKIIMALVVAAAAFCASAYDGTVLGCYKLGSTDSDTFDSYMETDQADKDVLSVLKKHFGLKKEKKFFVIGSDKVDEEDEQLMEDTGNYIASKVSVNDGDYFVTVVVRGQNGKDKDGWAVVSYYEGGWDTYLYYFSGRF